MKEICTLSNILFSPECKELISMLDPLLYMWGVPPVVIRCVHWTMQMGVLQTWITTQSTAMVMVTNWLFSAANLALAGFPLTKSLGENLPSRL